MKTMAVTRKYMGVKIKPRSKRFLAKWQTMNKPFFTLNEAKAYIKSRKR